MSTSRQTINVSGIAVDVFWKQIRHLHVGVYPPSGRVRVAAPARLDAAAVRLAVISRLAWIRRKKKAFEEQARQSRREMVTGESHYFQGRRYLLNVIETDRRPSVHLVGRATIELRIRPRSDCQTRELVLQQWYRQQLREQIHPLLAKWEPRIGETVAQVRIKRMKTLWGSCNVRYRRVWLNLELAKKPTSCLELILVHEMVHFLEPHHNERFRELMDVFLPSWRRIIHELNSAPLAHEEWSY